MTSKIQCLVATGYQKIKKSEWLIRCGKREQVPLAHLGTRICSGNASTLQNHEMRTRLCFRRHEPNFSSKYGTNAVQISPGNSQVPCKRVACAARGDRVRLSPASSLGFDCRQQLGPPFLSKAGTTDGKGPELLNLCLWYHRPARNNINHCIREISKVQRHG